MSTAKYRKILQKQQQRQAKIIEQLIAVKPMLQGTVSRVHTRCGKPNCWCADSDHGHPHLRITWSQDGKMITRKVPSGELSRVLGLTENYRRFRALRRKLAEINIRVKQILDYYETAVNNDVRKGMPFLGSVTKNAGYRPKRLQKPARNRKGAES